MAMPNRVFTDTGEHMHENFFALISRMRYIGRWGLMRNSAPENIQEHSHMVAVIAHALAVIRRDVFGQACDPDHCAAMALYHDASEIITGDLPTPIKYHNAQLTRSYKEVEHLAAEKLVTMLPEELHPAFEELLLPDEQNGDYQLVKAADKLSAYIKCIEERRTGNTDFLSAERQTAAALAASPLPEVAYFLEHFIPAFERTLDELGTI
jgi:5'-deoxynucleotidase